MFVAVWVAAAVLAVLHQDLWFWDNRTLVFGILPIGLFYHAVFSIVCAGLWVLALKFCWPTELEEWAEGGDQHTGPGSGTDANTDARDGAST